MVLERALDLITVALLGALSGAVAFGGELPAAVLVLMVFALAALSWISQQWLVKWTGLPISDTVIALCAAALLFLLPGEKGSGTALLEWKDSQNVPWGVLLLFGGGLSMADQIQKTGVAELLAQQLQLLDGVPPILLLVAVTSLIIFLTGFALVYVVV